MKRLDVPAATGLFRHSIESCLKVLQKVYNVNTQMEDFGGRGGYKEFGDQPNKSLELSPLTLAD
jgi:hypothetical protein